jgi:hypothetical protein
MSEVDPKFEAALAAASEEVGLATHYRSCVKPIFNAPPERWPRCCGGGCEPCNEVLCEVARRTRAKLDGAGEAPHVVRDDDEAEGERPLTQLVRDDDNRERH